MLSSCAGLPPAASAVQTSAGGGAGRDCVALSGMFRILRPEPDSAPAKDGAVAGEQSGERERAREVRLRGDGLRGAPTLLGGPSRSIAFDDAGDALVRNGLVEDEAADDDDLGPAASAWFAASCLASRFEMKPFAGGLEAYACARPGRTRVGVVEGEAPALPPPKYESPPPYFTGEKEGDL